MLVDARMSFPHEPIFSEFPIFISVSAEPLATVVVVFVGVADRNPIVSKRPKLFYKPVVEFFIPLTCQERFGFSPVLGEFGAISPARVQGVG